MEDKSSAVAVHLSTFILALLGIFSASIATETDIACLKSIKASLEDPYGYLKSSWDFNNNTEGYICRFTGVDCWHPDESKILNLRLSDMGLKGQFPLGIENCTSLTGLDLSNNELQGPIPHDISKRIKYITSLDLSFNNFSGEIPSSIANCSNLNVLMLDHNRLTGQIPPEIGLLSRIKKFNVANNQLSGPVPNIVNPSISADSYANNLGLCGPPLESCREKFKWRFDYSFRGGFAIGYVVSAVSTIVLYASYCVPWMRIGKRNEMITIPEMVTLMLKKIKKKNAEIDHLASLSTVDFLHEKEISTSENIVTRMSYKDLLEATENFGQHNLIGLGQIGTMFRATLSNGWFLAVKKLYNSPESAEQFTTELKILGRIRHKNIIPLIGFCKESNKRLLVYNYASNGNLSDWLHSVDGKKKKNILKWPLRRKIAVDLARGLAWLHHLCDFRVAHLNISSKCILLDQNFKPKLSNFGMATLLNPNEINNQSRGGFLMDIEFWEECFLKEDVFNFGIVLLELITGKKVTSLTNSDKWMSFLASSISFPVDEVDELLIGQGNDKEIIQFLRVAGNCVQLYPEQRPSMLDVCTDMTNVR